MRFVWLWLLLGAACSGGAPHQDLPPTALQKSPPPQVSPEGMPVPPPSGSLALPPLTAAERGPDEENGRSRIGAHRELPSPLPGAWAPSAEGPAVWRLQLQSAEAVAIRLHFTEFHVGDGSVTVFESDEELRPAVERRYEGDGPGADGEFWSDLLEGDSVIIQYHPAAGEEPSGAPPFRIQEISHMWQSPLDLF